MRLVSLHGNGTPHREWLDVYPTDEPWAFYIPSNRPIREASGDIWSSSYPVIALFWPDRFYQVFILCKSKQTEYYCNVITPPTYEPETGIIRFHDLDLDVYVSAKGVRLLDEEDFVCRLHEYPDEWVREARLAQAEVAQLAEHQRGPFAPATANRWRGWCRLTPL